MFFLYFDENDCFLYLFLVHFTRKKQIGFHKRFFIVKNNSNSSTFPQQDQPILYKFSHKMSNSFSRLCYTDIETVNLCMANFCRSRQSQLLAGGNKLKLVIYGTDTCKDCVNAKALLDAKGIRYLLNFLTASAISNAS